MDDAFGWIVALGVSFVVFRYFFGSSDPSTPRPRRVVPQASIDQVASMFPHVPLGAIRYELERTGSVEGTVERCLRDGRLPEPPAGFFIDPSLPSRPAVAATTLAALAASSTPSRSGTPASLIARMGLQGRVVESGEGKKAVWEMSAEGRERSLVERKARMVLEARRKLLEKEKARKEAA